MKKAKVLIFDIETAPILGHVWGLFDQNVALNQIQRDWHVLAWAAKWLGAAPVMYMDQRGVKDKEDDKKILQGIWTLLDEADVVITQNGKSFDAKKLNARFILQGFEPPSHYKHIDTLRIARKHFGFTSNKLAYLTDKLCTKYKKLVGHKFEGFELWKECLRDNPKAWREMERYNKRDVLSLEELYGRLSPWANTVNFNLYTDGDVTECRCGSGKLQRRGYYYTAAAKYQKYRCMNCGHETYSGKNLLAKKLHKEVPK